MKYAHIIKIFRGFLGLSKTDFASILNVTPQAVYNWENGKTPKSKILYKLDAWGFDVFTNGDNILKSGTSRLELIDNITKDIGAHLQRKIGLC